MSLILRSSGLAKTMAAAALRSAQTVSPYETFSTLQPACTAPPSVKIAAPTRKPLYGE